MTLVSIAEFRRHRQISKPTFGKWRAQGFIVMKRGKVDQEASDKRLGKRPETYRGGTTKQLPGHKTKRLNGHAGPSVAHSRHKRLVFEARLAERRFLREASRHVLVSDADETVAAEWSKVVAALDALPDRVKIPANTSDPTQWQQAVDGAINATLEELCAQWSSQAAAAEPAKPIATTLPATATAARAYAHREQFLAERRRLEDPVAAGASIEVDDTIATVTRRCVALRSRLMQLGAQLAVRLAGAVSEHNARTLLSAAVEALLAEEETI